MIPELKQPQLAEDIEKNEFQMRYNINFKFTFTPNDKQQAEYKKTKKYN